MVFYELMLLAAFCFCSTGILFRNYFGLDWLIGTGLYGPDADALFVAYLTVTQSTK